MVRTSLQPGYFTGANIHPLIRGRHPNKGGYLLILGASMTTISALLGAYCRYTLETPLLSLRRIIERNKLPIIFCLDPGDGMDLTL